MRSVDVAVALAAFARSCVAAEAAAVSFNNPDVTYMATLPDQPFSSVSGLTGNVKGTMMASPGPNGVGVEFTVNFSNLPKEGGPFTYHLHVNSALNGNCTSTGAHLDPENRGEQPPCDPSNMSTCQVGDLAGKYGKITSDPFTAKYVDNFASLREGTAAFFGNRSFVIHLANSTRVTCANFVSQASSPNCGGPPGTPMPGTGVTPPNGAVPPPSVPVSPSPGSNTSVPVPKPIGTGNGTGNGTRAPAPIGSQVNSSRGGTVTAAADAVSPGVWTWLAVVPLLALLSL